MEAVEVENFDRICESVIAIVRDILEDDSVNLDTAADTNEGWDSFAHMELVNAIEGHFEIKFDITDALTLQSVSTLSEGVARCLHRAAPA